MRALASRLDLRTQLQNYGLITIGVLVAAANVNLSLAPANIAPVSRPHARALRRVVTEADPKAFLVIGHGHQATGGVYGQMGRSRPFKQSKRPNG